MENFVFFTFSDWSVQGIFCWFSFGGNFCVSHALHYIWPWDFIWICIHIYGFPGGSVVKNPPANVGEVGSIPGSGRSPREGNSNPLQYSCLKNPTDREAWWTTVHGVAKSWTQFIDWTRSRSHPQSTQVPWELHREGGWSEQDSQRVLPTFHSHKWDHRSLMHFRRQSVPKIEVDKQWVVDHFRKLIFLTTTPRE